MTQAWTEDTFWAAAGKGRPEECWLWRGCLNAQGYGWTSWHGRNDVLAHRKAYALARGPIPAGICVLHRCDTPRCCNPAHLFLGSRTENAADSMLKGRKAKKLTPERVRWIREWAASGAVHENIAALFQVSQVMVSKIVRRAAWAWVA